MAFSTNGPKGLSSEINVTPLIDVLLVLLIIFMVIVPVAPLGLDAALPTPGQPAAERRPEAPLMVRVAGEADHPAYWVDGAAVSSDELAGRLQSTLATRAERQMLIDGDARLDYSTISDLVNLGAAAGAQTVGLVTRGAAK